MAQALSMSVPDTELQYEVKESTKKYLVQSDPELADKLSDKEDRAFKIAEKAHVNKDFKKAIKYYLIAVKNKHTVAMYKLALIYHAEYKDFQKAEKYYLMAIDNKFPFAMNSLALLYHSEYKDSQKAEKYYLMAIDYKFPFSKYNLAVLYHYECKDFQKAEEYYLLAVKIKHVIAMYNLALLYEDGFKNSQKTKKYYLMGIKHDFRNNMDSLVQTSFSNNNEIKRFLYIFEKYSKKTDHICLFALSIMLIHAEKYKESVEYFNLFLDLTVETDNFQNHIANYFLLLISRKQLFLAHNLFQQEKYRLKEKIKPVYYALMNLMQETYPKEYKRMGSEIQDTVFEVLEKIKRLEEQVCGRKNY